MRPLAFVLLAAALLVPAGALAQEGEQAPVEPNVTILSKSIRNPDNRVRLRLKCADGVRDVCKGTLSAKATSGGPVLVSGPLEVPSGSDTVITFRVTTAGKTAFKKKRSITMRSTIAAKDSAGLKASTVAVIVVKRGR